MMKREPMLRNAFSELNPFVLLAYYGVVLVASATLLHPALLIVSLIGGILTASCRMGAKRALLRFVKTLPLALLTAVVNPIFSHEGATILAYLPGGNPLTLESMLYGAAAGLMLLDSLMWFLTISETFTGEKWMYLLGKIVPALSLILSLIFRFVPKLLRQLRQINDALALSEKDQSRLNRAFHAFSAVISWALEDAAETADSMRCRGYGLPGRTAYNRYRFDLRDGIILAITVALSVGLFVYMPDYHYFPIFHAESVNAGMGCFALMCLLPAVTGWATELRYLSRLRRTRHEPAGN